jgi:hypothetical protein
MLIQQRRLGDMYGNASLLSQGGLGGSSDLSALRAATSAAKQAKETEQHTKQSESDSEDNEGESEEEQIPDDDYFKNFALKVAGTEESKTEEDESGKQEKADNESFPHKLYRMLHEAEQEGNAHIVSFLPSGRGFAIHEPQKFADIIGRYFTTVSYTV